MKLLESMKKLMGIKDPRAKCVNGYCQCDIDDKRIENITFLDLMPLKTGEHTMFYLNRCKECGGICGFPEDNFEIFMRNGSDYLVSAIKYTYNMGDFPKNPLN